MATLAITSTRRVAEAGEETNMPPLRGFYNPRNLFRTPGFAPEGLVDEEQQEQLPMPTAAESRAYMPPEPEQMDAPAPQQPERRSIDLSGELDRIKRAPAPPKVGKLRNVLGTLAGLYIPQIGEAIKRPGYADQMREFQADQEYANNRIGAMGKLATAEAGMARSAAEGERAGAQRAQRVRTEGQMANDGGFTLSDGQERFDKSGKSIAARAKSKVDDDIPITKELGEHLKLQPGADGVYKLPRVAADSLVRAAQPQGETARVKEVKEIIRGSSPNLSDAEVNAEASKVLKEEMTLKKRLTEAQIARALRPPRAAGVAATASAAAAGAEAAQQDATFQAIRDGRLDWHNLDVKTKGKYRNALVAAGWVEPKKFTEGERKDLSGIDDLENLVTQIDEMSVKHGGDLPGVGPVSGTIGKAGDVILGWSSDDDRTARQLVGQYKAAIAKLNAGTALSENEKKMLEEYVPITGENTKVTMSKIKGAKSFLANRKKNRTAHASGGRTAGAPPTAPAAGSVEMTKIDKDGKKTTRMVAPDKVKAARAMGYK